MDIYKAYSNQEIMLDAEKMLEEITHPREERTQKLLEEEEVFSPGNDDVDIFLYNHFKKKYPKLEKFTKPLFMMIVKDKRLDIELLQNFLQIRERMYGKKDMSYDQGTEIFGKILAEKFIEPLAEDKEEFRQKMNEIYSNQRPYYENNNLNKPNKNE